jgi:L-alanine-DL-glutamate epimerase-like enolase superfamily enzyme
LPITIGDVTRPTPNGVVTSRAYAAANKEQIGARKRAYGRENRERIADQAADHAAADVASLGGLAARRRTGSLLRAVVSLLLANHVCRVLSAVPWQISLIPEYAMLGSLDLVATPQLSDESDHHISSHKVDEPLPQFPIMPSDASGCHLATRANPD